MYYKSKDILSIVISFVTIFVNLFQTFVYLPKLIEISFLVVIPTGVAVIVTVAVQPSACMGPTYSRLIPTIVIVTPMPPLEN